VYLVDSGGQYYGGTTDVTRTISFKAPTDEQKKMFTLVLMGNIALSKVVFKEGTTGAELDILARQYLWQYGFDYEHATGHGVGACLSVHEGPAYIGKHSTYPLKNGMIISNEPGFYKSGEYGIRIENLMLVKKHKQKGFLCFETLTNIGIDKELIDYNILDKFDISSIRLI
jgi:Xaa-Pro aminopeptidase